VGVFRKLKSGKSPTVQYSNAKLEYYDLNNLSSFNKVICVNTGKAHKDYKNHPNPNKREMLLTQMFIIPHGYGGYVYKSRDKFTLACSQIRQATF
jgi:hypothetical protein